VWNSSVVVKEEPRLTAEKISGAKKEKEREKTGENYVTRISCLPNIRVMKSNGIVLGHRTV
jgi:hypothetical protein